MTKLYDNVDHLGTNASAAYTVETDVLVVGAGNAGMEAAAAVKEAGAKTILIEKEKTINLMRVGLASVGSRAQKAAGVAMKQVGLVLEGRGVLREGMKVVVDGAGEGITTSGTFSPTLKQAIAIARVPAATTDRAAVEVRGQLVAARVVKLPFVRNGKKVFD